MFLFSSCYIHVLTPLLCVSCLTESSKELEELRGAFSRSLDYMKQDVEERMCIWLWLRLILPLLCLILFYPLCHCRVWRKWRSILYHNADLGKNRGVQCWVDDVHCVTVDLNIIICFCCSDNAL